MRAERRCEPDVERVQRLARGGRARSRRGRRRGRGLRLCGLVGRGVRRLVEEGEGRVAPRGRRRGSRRRGRRGRRVVVAVVAVRVLAVSRARREVRRVELERDRVLRASGPSVSARSGSTSCVSGREKRTHLVHGTPHGQLDERLEAPRAHLALVRGIDKRDDVPARCARVAPRGSAGRSVGPIDVHVEVVNADAVPEAVSEGVGGRARRGREGCRGRDGREVDEVEACCDTKGSELRASSIWKKREARTVCRADKDEAAGRRGSVWGSRKRAREVRDAPVVLLVRGRERRSAQRLVGDALVEARADAVEERVAREAQGRARAGGARGRGGAGAARAGRVVDGGGREVVLVRLGRGARCEGRVEVGRRGGARVGAVTLAGALVDPVAPAGEALT